MATWKPAGLIVKGAQAAFHQTLDAIPSVWQDHCAIYQSDTAVEPHAFPGFIPRPREFLSGRQIQGLRDFTYNVTNNEYELSIAIDRKHFEDDQTGLIAERMKEMAETWGTFKDYLFAQLLINGSSSGFTAFDGTIFYADTRVIGASANIDNLTTSVAAADPAVPTTAEFLADLKLSKASIRKYQDDTGKPFNSLAVQDLRVIIPPDFEAPVFEALNATFISTTDNVFRGMAQMDVLDYLSAKVMYVNAVGATRKPFIMQQRMPLEIEILDSPEAVALHNAVLVLCRERFVFAYGDPRRSIEHTYTT